MSSLSASHAALGRARELLAGVEGRALSRGEVEGTTLALARELFLLSDALRDPRERARRQRLAALLEDPAGQLLSVFLTDRVARDKTFEHAAGQLSFLLSELGTPRFMGALERLQLALGGPLGNLAPRTVGKLMARRIQAETRGLVFPLERGELGAYLDRRRKEGVRVNLNQLGEEVLGERQAVSRLAHYVALLREPRVETISVKLSSIFSQIDLYAWDASHEQLGERLRQVYRAALPRKAGEPCKLVYLDMEAHRDLRFTVELVRSVLDEPEFSGLSAGLVLQAYVPESAALQRELIAWALERRRRGGAPLRLRVVKGANLAAERVYSSRMGWRLPIYGSKHEVDANYKRMLYAGSEPEHAHAIHLGVASHNLFDLALGMVLRASRKLFTEVGFEMLEGMAPALERALAKLGAPVLVYAPAVERGDLDTAVAYLIRRLDENTARENFLRHAFAMRLDDAVYTRQAERFRLAHQSSERVSDTPLRSQDRFAEIVDRDPSTPFVNEPDTDFSIAAHRKAVRQALSELARRPCFELTSIVEGEPVGSADREDGFDPSRPSLVPYRYQLAAGEALNRAVFTARRGFEAWSRTPVAERAELAFELARRLRHHRAELIAAMVLDAGKRAVEADSEVSEAVDFAEYYARSALELARDAALSARPKGVVLVTSPWNFPLAIPLSGILAALLAGNAVIFKPARETVFVGARLAHWAWQAGFPKDALALVLCRDSEGTLLLEHPGVDAVVLTGATSTAKFFLERRPSLDLHAETGGKNALIITRAADRELAIKDLLASAFGYAGQKCSAASLCIVEAGVYDDAHFREQLRDAAASLAVGSAWSADSVVTPLIRPPEPALLRGLTELDRGEAWLLEPRRHPDNVRLWSPGIKLGVAPNSFSHQTELFGPVISVLRARDLEHAIELANGTPYGLTAGLHSLDEREQARFLRSAAAGNLYVNRTITGAIVGRQPFGGHKASSVGPGAKAGGPNYVAQLSELSDAREERGEASSAEPVSARARPIFELARATLSEHDCSRLAARARNYAHWRESYFERDHPAPEILGQANLSRYQPLGSLLLVAAGAPLFELSSACLAALECVPDWELAVLSGAAGADGSERLTALAAALGVVAAEPTPPELCARIASRKYERVRWLGASNEVPREVLLAAMAAGSYVEKRPVLAHGRHELARYHREQSISLEYHRYGHLGWLSEGLPGPRELPALRDSRRA